MGKKRSDRRRAYLGKKETKTIKCRLCKIRALRKENKTGLCHYCYGIITNR